MTFFFALFVVVGVLFGVSYFKENAIKSNDNLENVNSEVISNEPRLSCFDFIDKQLVADGFTYLQDAKWSRGPYNKFIVDLVSLEFIFIQDVDIENGINYGRNVSDWHTEVGEWNDAFIYNHYDRKVWSSGLLTHGLSKLDSAAEVNYNPQDVTSNFYEFYFWMDYYINQSSKYGCSIENLTIEKLMNDYTTLESSATQSEVVSVFDRKSEDNVVRYFADVHIEGNIEDNPRYKELLNKEEYLKLDNAENYETVYFINVLYNDPTQYTFYLNHTGVQERVIKEFTKDVVFTKTTWIEDDPTNETIGTYFIYVDNPNGEFEHLYIPPVINGARVDYSLNNFNSIRTPFDGFVMLVNKSQVEEGQVYEIGPKNRYETLKFYLQIIKEVNQELEYSEDFVTNYTRPFNSIWQNQMGLTEHFDAKYGFINNDIKYKSGPVH